jgi:hypothetical protein
VIVEHLGHQYISATEPASLAAVATWAVGAGRRHGLFEKQADKEPSQGRDREIAC